MVNAAGIHIRKTDRDVTVEVTGPECGQRLTFHMSDGTKQAVVRRSERVFKLDSAEPPLECFSDNLNKVARSLRKEGSAIRPVLKAFSFPTETDEDFYRSIVSYLISADGSFLLCHIGSGPSNRFALHVPLKLMLPRSTMGTSIFPRDCASSSKLEDITSVD